jgi:hypothetical protein
MRASETQAGRKSAAARIIVGAGLGPALMALRGMNDFANGVSSSVGTASPLGPLDIRAEAPPMEPTVDLLF